MGHLNIVQKTAQVSQNETSLKPSKARLLHEIKQNNKNKNTVSPEHSKSERTNSSVTGTSLWYLTNLWQKAPQPRHS